MREIHNVQVPFDVPPRRVVSLVPSLTLSLFELNLGDRLVGVTTYCTEPAAQVARLRRIGGPIDPDIAQIEALRPDLVIADDDDNRDEDIMALREAGITVWVIKVRRVKEVIDLLWAMMYAFDDATMLPRVQVIERGRDYLELAVQNQTPRRVFVPVWRAPWMSFNQDTYIHDLLRICGASNVFAAKPERYFAITEDEIIAAQPEMVLLPDDPYAFGQEDVEDLRRLDIPAARTGCIHLVEGRRLVWYGTETARALGELPHLIARAPGGEG